MIEVQDFKEVLEAGDHLVAPRVEGETFEDRLERERVVWAERGVDVRAIEAYAVLEAEDSVSMALTAAGVPDLAPNVAIAMTPVSLRALIAATVEMAFGVGWHMRERKYRSELL